MKKGAICRTRIRRHDKSPIGIHISSDWSNETIQMTKRYLGLTQVRSGIQIMLLENTIAALMTKGITPKRAEKIARLNSLDQNIVNSIMLGTQYSCSLYLDDVFKLLPSSRKEVDKYNSLINYLGTLGISLKIYPVYKCICKFTKFLGKLN